MFEIGKSCRWEHHLENRKIFHEILNQGRDSITRDKEMSFNDIAEIELIGLYNHVGTGKEK